MRVDVAAGAADVTLVGVGGGVAYGFLGLAHRTVDKCWPRPCASPGGVTMLASADAADAAAAADAALALDGPLGLRLEQDGEPSLLAPRSASALGRATSVRDGADIAIACTGRTLGEAVGAAPVLRAAGRRRRGAALRHRQAASSAGTILAALARTSTILTLEEHSMIGGFGGAVAEVAAEAGIGRVLRAGFPDTFIHEVGTREHLLEHYGLDAAGVAARAAAALDIAPSPRRLTLQRGLA